MGDFSRLVPIFKLIEDKAAAKTGTAIKNYESLHRQLQQLQQYRAEYQNIDTNVPVLLSNAKSFLGRLDSSIEDTEQRLAAKHRSVDHEKQKWSTARSRRKAVELLAKKDQKSTAGNTVDSLFYWQARCRKIDEL